MTSGTTISAGLPGILAANGVDLVFGVPGNHTVALYRGFADAGIRHVTCRHEQGAAFMADGYARSTGRPGVCVLISGPGLLNAATAIAQARADSVPMLIISGVAAVPDLGMDRGTLHELPDQRATAASFCRSAHTLLAADNLPDLMCRAFTSFRTARPGPVHIEIPLDLMEAPLSAPAHMPPIAIAPPAPDPDLIHAAATRLTQAQRPLLLIGGGTQNAAEEVLALAVRLDAPVLNTVNGKGVVPATHPLAVGGSPSLPCLRRALEDADAILAMGTEMGETDYDLLMAGPVARHPGIIRLDIDPQQLLIPMPPAVGIVSDAASGAVALCGALAAAAPAAAGTRAASGAKRAATLRRAIRQEAHFHPEIEAVLDALRAASANAIIVGDSTRPTYYAAWMLECERPRRYFHSVTGFGTLGYALPAAFGAALGTSQPVIALIGDGGIQFTLPELGTATELGLGVPVILWHNSGYREIENSMLAKNVPVESTRIAAPDFAAAARAFGAAYARPDTLAALTAATEAALAAQRPTLIEVQEARFVTRPSGRWY